LKVVGLQGLSTVAEAGVADVNRLTAFIRKQGVKAVFVESSVPPAAMKRIAELSGVRVGGELFSDSLGAFESGVARFGSEEEATGGYLGMMRHNLRTVAEGLA
jgi:manganese/zinc/iron transport system substrate-binding protein